MDAENYFYGAFWFDGAANRLENIKQNLVDPEKLDIHGVQGIFDFEVENG